MTTTPTPVADLPTPPKPRRRWPWVVLAAVIVLGVLGAFGLYWFFKDDSPPPVSLERAVASLDGTTTAAPATTVPPATTSAGVATTAPAVATTTPPAAEGIEGTWRVDTSIGEFSFEEATGTFVGFRVDEELRGIGSTTAVGRTPVVSGTVTIEGTTLTGVDVTADLSQLTTNESRRDSRARGALDTDQFPNATFVLAQPVELGPAAATGGPVSVTAAGDLTIHGVTKRVEVPIQAQLKDGVVVVVGSLPVVFADYGVSVPSAPVVVSAEDNGIIEMQLLLTRG